MPPTDELDAEGGVVGCECANCRELRLRDPDRIVYGPWDLVRAYSQGWRDGHARIDTDRGAAHTGQQANE